MSPRTFIRRPADWSWEEQSSVVDEEFAGIRVVHPGGHLVKALDRMVTALDVGIVGVEHVRLTNLVALDERVEGLGPLRRDPDVPACILAGQHRVPDAH